MEEQNNKQNQNQTFIPEVDHQTNKVVPQKNHKTGRWVKRILLFAILGLVGYAVYSVADILLSPDRNIQQIYLIPEDAAFIIETSDPINDWRKFNQSETWQCLKKAKSIDEIATTIESLDSVVRNNETLLSLVGKRDILISLHKVRTTDWDFLAVIDMQKASKMDMLKNQIENVLKLGGGTVTQRTYDGITILEMRDPETRNILYMAFVENHLVLSYTSMLVEKSIDSRKSPKIGLNHAFIEAEKLVSGKGLLRVYINYANLPQFMSIYLGGRNEYVDFFSNSMDFAGLYFNTDKEKMEIKGYTLRKEEAVDPYVAALLNSGKHKMKAHEIMTARTALYTNIGFDNPVTFVKELENALSVKDKATYDDYKNTRKKIEKFFGISLEEHFLSWMSGEFAMSQSEPGLLGHDPELILAIQAKDIKDAHKKMDFIEKKIKNRTPLKIKTVNYKDFEVKYLEMKGFFRLFFGSLFDKFEKPYYTYIDDYVVFSNKAATLLSFIEDYDQKNFLKNDPGFKKAYSYFNSNSTVFVFTDVQKFFPQLKPMLNATTWREVQTNKDVLYSFPYWSMQIVGNNPLVSLYYVMDFKPYAQEVAPVVEVEDAAVDVEEGDETSNETADETLSEKDLMNELQRFYVEKFEGNVLREFYPEGALKSESEVKDGKRHGRYREYYESGKLKVRGKYSKNNPKGTWKYYTEEGKFERKEKF